MDTKILIDIINEGIKEEFEKIHEGNTLYLNMLKYCVENKKAIPLDNLIDYSNLFMSIMDENYYDLENASMWLLMLIQESYLYNKSLK